MKKIFLILAITFLATSCINEDLESLKLDLDNLSPYTEKVATIKEGYITRIYADDILICETSVPTSYYLPKGAIERIDTIPNNKAVKFSGWDTYQFTATFEDTRNGDNDYNDFVCFITRDKVGIWDHWPNDSVKITMYIQPIAYGAGTVLQFGMTLPDGTDTIFTNNIQRDLFPGTSGFVNTTNFNNIYQTADANHIIKFVYYRAGRGDASYPFHPFIINQSGEKLYVALNGKKNVVKDYLSLAGILGYPLGIATSGQFAYPLEKINIATCYPGFNNWVVGNSSELGNYSNNRRDSVFHRVDWDLPSGIIKFNPQSLWPN
ncbi:MAG: hypothetical protein H6Q16_1113 [Bacteroidetes bacterium]|nr:hypothetical protein [Bacteroidota bacterium]